MCTLRWVLSEKSFSGSAPQDMTCIVLRMLAAVSPEHEHMLDLLTVLSGLHGKLVSFEAKVLKTE